MRELAGGLAREGIFAALERLLEEDRDRGDVLASVGPRVAVTVSVARRGLDCHRLCGQARTRLDPEVELLATLAQRMHLALADGLNGARPLDWLAALADGLEQRLHWRRK